MAKRIPGTSNTAGLVKIHPETLADVKISPNLCRWSPDDDSGIDWSWVEALALDIAKHGQEQPVVVRQLPDDSLELIAGRHRYHAVQRINDAPEDYALPGAIPLLAIHKVVGDEEAIALSFRENTGKPLGPMDLAKAAHRFKEVCKYSHKQIGALMNYSPMRVAQLLQLIKLPLSIQKHLHLGVIKEAHARDLLALKVSVKEMNQIAEDLTSGDLTSAQLVKMANDRRRQQTTKEGKPKRIKRGIGEIRTALQEIGSSRAECLLEWIDGNPAVDEQILIDLFTDSPDVEFFFQKGDEPSPEERKKLVEIKDEDEDSADDDDDVEDSTDNDNDDDGDKDETATADADNVDLNEILNDENLSEEDRQALAELMEMDEDGEVDDDSNGEEDPDVVIFEGDDPEKA